MLGDIYLADLNPSRGSEQAGIRPVIIVQRDTLDRFTTTVVVIPVKGRQSCYNWLKFVILRHRRQRNLRDELLISTML